MRRVAVVVALVASAWGTGCVGDTDPASNLRATQARLNAHGHTDNGPASWWWEYGTRRSTVEGGQATRTPRRGPATSAADVTLGESVGGLQPDQPYYFRACGQDAAAGSPVRCGQVRRFRTSPADSTVTVVRPAGGGTPFMRYTAAVSVRHDVSISDRNGPVSETLADTTGQDPPLLGATIAAGAGCQAAADARGYLTEASCPEPLTTTVATLGPLADRVRLPLGGTVLHLGGGDDVLELGFGRLPEEVYGDAGADDLSGGDGNDFISGGEGNDHLAGGARGADGNDVLVGGPGADFYSCDSTRDIVFADHPAEASQAQAVGCTVVIATAAAIRAARLKQVER